jgi:lactoylglutathione lyase
MQKLLLACSFLLIVLASNAQPATPLKLTFNHLALSVKDLDKSADFYTSVLGLTEITNRTKMEGIRWFSLAEGKELHLISIIKDPVVINKAVHLALAAGDFDMLIKRFDDMHITYYDWPGTAGKVNIRADGVKQIYIRDPDGYWIEINSALKQ